MHETCLYKTEGTTWCMLSTYIMYVYTQVFHIIHLLICAVWDFLYMRIQCRKLTVVVLDCNCSLIKSRCHRHSRLTSCVGERHHEPLIPFNYPFIDNENGKAEASLSSWDGENSGESVSEVVHTSCSERRKQSKCLMNGVDRGEYTFIAHKGIQVNKHFGNFYLHTYGYRYL